MRQLGWIVCAWLVGCGGGATPEPATASEPPAETETAKSEGDDSPSKPAPEKAEPEGEASPQSGASLNDILQRVIEDEELDKVLHLEKPGRFPFKVAGKDLPSGLSLTKGTKPVSVVSEPSSKKEPVLVFTSIEISGKDAVVAYRWDIEGIKGTARLTKGPQGWELTSSRLVER
jgi:hypothetical protein